MVEDILNWYLVRNPVYRDVKFSKADEEVQAERLPNLLIFTQYIIDRFIADGEKRIAIVLPDDECNIIPLLITKCINNINTVENYTSAAFENIQPGQRMRMGNSVVEFIELGEDINHRKTIKFKSGTPKNKDGVQIITERLAPYHFLLEKCDGAMSTYSKYVAEKKKQIINYGLNEENNSTLNALANRTSLNKTIVLLSGKNDFRDFTGSLLLNGQDFRDVMAYGEIDDEENRYTLYNNGKLDCIPAVTVSPPEHRYKYLPTLFPWRILSP